ncbi:non-specific serine/threonine protein kinase [Ranunculus cassubicifolius]
MASPQTFFLILFILFLSPLASSKKKHVPTGPVTNVTKYLTFQTFHLQTNPRLTHDIKLLGSAKFSSQNGSIQIPDPAQSQVDLKYQAGRAIYSSPIRLLDPLTHTPASFHTTFSFQFNIIGTSPSDAGGSGLTFIIVPDELTVGRSGPWLAMMNDACDDDYKAIAVEFDTRQNLEVGDPNDNHVGINLGSIVSSTTVNASDVGVSLKDGSTHRAWIIYDGTTKHMDIRLGSDDGDFPSKPIFSSTLDLSPYLKEYMFVGFSASTGNKTQIHNILSWNFSSNSEAFLKIPSEESCEKKLLQRRASMKPPSSFLIFISVVFLVLVVLLNIYCTRNRKDQNSTDVVFAEKKQRPRPPNKPRRFTVSEISTATRGFSEGELLSSDSRGVFYRGTISNGCQVAVMRFSTRFLNSAGLDRKRVVKEIGKVSRIRHPNLVSVRGWCYDKKEMMVVYDYFPNGSLDRWLFGIGVLPWTRRFKVIKDVAESLNFLHSKKLAHRNVKTSSVFFDITFRAVLGDFGFGGTERVEPVNAQKADVFQFGIVLLEIVAGKRSEEEDEMSLLDFAWRMHEQGELVKIIDRGIGAVINSEQASRVVQIGLLCTINDSGIYVRPPMEDVVGFLNNMDSPISDLPPRRPVSLFPYKSATDLCGAYTCTPFM